MAFNTETKVENKTGTSIKVENATGTTLDVVVTNVTQPTGVAFTTGTSVTVPVGNRALRLIASVGWIAAADETLTQYRELLYNSTLIALVAPGGPIIVELSDANVTSGTFELSTATGLSGILTLISVDA